MADYTIKTEVSKRIVYTLPSPTVWAEVAKVLNAMKADMEDRGIDTSWDDAAKVEAWDDEIRFSFEVESDD